MAFVTSVIVGTVVGGVGTLLHQNSSHTRLVDKLIQISHKEGMDSTDKPMDRPVDESLVLRKKTPIKVIRRNLVVAVVSSGLAYAGTVYAPLALLSVPGLLYCLWPFYQNTYHLLRAGQVGIDTLVLLMIIGCLFYGEFLISGITFVIAYLARALQVKVTESYKNELLTIFTELPNTVWVRLEDGIEISMSAQDIKMGDELVVHAGEIVPADGQIIEGMASVDQHILTGEAAPVDRSQGEDVFALTTVLSGRIVIRVECAGDETAAANIAQILNRTIEFKSTVELRAAELSDQTAMPTLALSTLAIPFLGAYSAVALLASHFRYKVLLITPISILVFFRSASQHGILVKDGRSLDLAKQVDTIVFDKTGTLTDEQPAVGQIYTLGEHTEECVLRYAAAAESWQTHPIAKAICHEANDREIELPIIDDADYHVGFGLSVTMEGKRILVGSVRFMEMNGVAIPENLNEAQTICHSQGHSLVMVAIDRQMVGGIELLPSLRPETHALIQQLRQRKQIKQIVLISGDHQRPTQVLAERLGIDQWHAQTLPEQKAEKIEQLKQAGHYVCYVGDGINDAIAMKTSHVSVSLRDASTLAMDTAQIILLNGGLSRLDKIFELAQRFHSNTDRTFGLQLASTMVGAGGVLLFGFGIHYAMIAGWVGLGAGLFNAMMPLLESTHKQKN